MKQNVKYNKIDITITKTVIKHMARLSKMPK